MRHYDNILVFTEDLSCLQKEFQYSLLSDPDRVFVAALGAKDPKSGKTKRAHFIFAKGGKLVEKKLPVSPADRYAGRADPNQLLMRPYLQSHSRPRICQIDRLMSRLLCKERNRSMLKIM